MESNFWMGYLLYKHCNNLHGNANNRRRECIVPSLAVTWGVDIAARELRVTCPANVRNRYHGDEAAR
jgi:hypothetical protein